MRNMTPPFKFDLRNLLTRARQQINNRVSGIEIKLPFITFSVQPEATEKKIAKEIVIRLADRRVLNTIECCDSCIENALASLQEIRSLLVDKQVEMANLTNTVLYVLTELMLEAIRQFLTYEEQLRNHKNSGLELPEYYRPPDIKEQYYSAPEMLRAHLHRCLLQISSIAEIDIPKIADHIRYDQKWPIEVYKKLTLET